MDKISLKSLRSPLIRYKKFVEEVTKICPETVMIQDVRTGELVIKTGFVDDKGRLYHWTATGFIIYWR